MVVKYRFEVDVGVLSVMHSTEETSISVEFEFEAFATGKLYILKMDEVALVAHHKVFAFDPTMISDITSTPPTNVEIKKSGPAPLTKDQFVKEMMTGNVGMLPSRASITYVRDVAGRQQTIIFDIPEKAYPEGSSGKVIELERMIRMHERTHAQLKQEIKDLREELDQRELEELREVVSVPYNALIVANQVAHAFMKEKDGYLNDEYSVFIKSRENASVDQLIAAFLETSEKRLLFNLHYMNWVDHRDFMAEAKISIVGIAYGQSSMGLSTGWTPSSLAFEVAYTSKKRSYEVRTMGSDMKMTNVDLNGKHLGKKKGWVACKHPIPIPIGSIRRSISFMTSAGSGSDMAKFDVGYGIRCLCILWR
jgi:hypothetical protein